MNNFHNSIFSLTRTSPKTSSMVCARTLKDFFCFFFRFEVCDDWSSMFWHKGKLLFVVLLGKKQKQKNKKTDFFCGKNLIQDFINFFKRHYRTLSRGFSRALH